MGRLEGDEPRVGRPPSCNCDECPKCKARIRARRRYQAMTPEERKAWVARRDRAKARAADRRRYRRDPQRRLDAQGRWKERQPQVAAASQRKAQVSWVERNPEKRRAHIAVSNALRRGKLEKGPCARESDGCKGRIQAHHEDYSKPLEVVWLCTRHHGETRWKAEV